MDEIIRKLHNISVIEDDWELDEIADKLEELKEDMILNLDNFKRELERAGLMTNKLENFIEDYMRWDNN